METKFKITCFTDLLCPWCWGVEPMMRALETHFPDRILIETVMGGLIPDLNADKPTDLTDEHYYGNVNKDYITHAARGALMHHMPIETEGFKLFSPTQNSSYPMNIAFKAAQLASPTKAEIYLYRLRAAALVQGRPIIAQEELITLAGECQIDMPAFVLHMTDGTAKEAFLRDLEMVKAHQVDIYPTYICQYGQKSLRLKGFNTYPTLAATIKALTEDQMQPLQVQYSKEALIHMLKDRKMAGGWEVKAAFDFTTIEKMEAAIAPEIEAGNIIKVDHSVGYMLHLPK